MRCGALLVLLVALVALPLSTFFLVDLPEGIQDPWRARAILTFLGINGFIWDSLEPLLGPDIHVGAVRGMLHYAYQYAPRTPLPSNIKVEKTTFGGVPVLVYIPTDRTPDGPGVVYFHGGGWVFGSVDYDIVPRRLAVSLKAVVVAVEYRLAPEHVYPVPLQDCETATVHFMDHALNYGVDPERIVVAGDSAGGNLAAAVALSLRNQEFFPLPAAQVLVYPALQALDFQTPSFSLHPRHPLIRRHIMASCWLWYAFGHASNKQLLLSNQHTSPELMKKMQRTHMNLDKLPKGFIPKGYDPKSVGIANQETIEEMEKIFMDPLFSPLMADDIRGLPTSLVVTVEHDVLRDEGAWYARRLADANVTTVHRHYTNGFHGILSFPELKESNDYLQDIVRFIQEHV